MGCCGSCNLVPQLAVTASIGLAVWQLLTLGTTAMTYQVIFAILAFIYQWSVLACARFVAFWYCLTFIFDFFHMMTVIIFNKENVGGAPWTPFWTATGVQFLFTLYFAKIVRDGVEDDEEKKLLE